jgi:hypothetical protein
MSFTSSWREIIALVVAPAIGDRENLRNGEFECSNPNDSMRAILVEPIGYMVNWATSKGD